MKKAILILALMGLSAATMAQNTKPAAPVKPPEHPGWQFKPATPVSFNVTIPVGLMDTYIFVARSGGIEAIENSDKLTGQQIKSVKAAHQAALDSVGISLLRAYNIYIKTDQDKFTSDTLKLYHPPVVNKK